MTETPIRLMGCPFCGSEGYTWQSTGTNNWYVECLSCDCAIDTGFDTEDEAIEVWNQRYKDSGDATKTT